MRWSEVSKMRRSSLPLLIYLVINSFAYCEIYMSLAVILARFDLELYDTRWERDVHYTRDCFLGEPDPASPGIRVKVVADHKTFTRS